MWSKSRLLSLKCLSSISYIFRPVLTTFSLWIRLRGRLSSGWLFKNSSKVLKLDGWVLLNLLNPSIVDFICFVKATFLTRSLYYLRVVSLATGLSS
jgi:hypothetical protein